MRATLAALLLCGTQLSASMGSCSAAEAPANPPGPAPERFAPGVISTEKHSETGCTFTPDGKAIYFTRSGGGLESPTIFLSRFRDSRWTEPEKAPLEGFGPNISPDGKRLFVSRYGHDEKGERTTELWFADREEDGWGVLQHHGPGNRPSLSGSLNLYFIDRSDENDRGVIVVQERIGGEYAEPRPVDGGVNTPHYEAHPCVARDESYIIFDSDRPGGYGKGDLYVSFRNDDGTWGDARNLGPSINTEGYEAYASISPDGKHLFYSSNEDGTFSLFRVDLEIVERLRE